MKNFLNAVLTWLKESWEATGEAALFTADFVDGNVGPLGE